MNMKNPKPKKYDILKMNISRERKEKYLAILQRRYNLPRSGFARLVLRALKEIIAIETENPTNAKV